MRAAAIVVNHNGGEDVRRCLEALAAQTVPVGVVLVDCASTDGSRALADQPPAGVTGLPLADNRGYAGGCNAGLAAVPAADVVGFFNPDCFPDPGFYAACLDVLARRPDAGGVAGRLVRPDRATLDSCGQVLTPLLLRVRDRGYGRPAEGAFPDPGRVLAACGAAAVYRRTALDAVALDGRVLPDEFFAFWEDLDLGWRVGNAGFPVLYEPSAVAVHRRGGSAERGAGRMVFRRPPGVVAGIVVNRWATLARNLHVLDFLPRAPVLLAGDMVMLALVLARRPRVFRPLLAALPRVAKALGQRRRLVQRRLRELA